MQQQPSNVVCRHPDIFKTDNNNRVVIEKGYEHTYPGFDRTEFTCSVKQTPDKHRVISYHDTADRLKVVGAVVHTESIPVVIVRSIHKKKNVFYLPLQHNRTIQETLKHSKLFAKLLTLKIVDHRTFIEMWMRPVLSKNVTQMRLLKIVDLKDSYEKTCTKYGFAHTKDSTNDSVSTVQFYGELCVYLFSNLASSSTNASTASSPDNNDSNPKALTVEQQDEMMNNVDFYLVCV
jgi:hypothetical protein